jgi:hypothetical protein
MLCEKRKFNNWSTLFISSFPRQCNFDIYNNGGFSKQNYKKIHRWEVGNGENIVSKLFEQFIINLLSVIINFWRKYKLSRIQTKKKKKDIKINFHKHVKQKLFHVSTNESIKWIKENLWNERVHTNSKCWQVKRKKVQIEIALFVENI